MKVFQHVNIVTCDQDFHVYLDGILAVKESQQSSLTKQLPMLSWDVVLVPR